MESNKEKFNINEYSASSSTLEQIFQNFAKMSIERSYTGEEKSKFPMLFKNDPTKREGVRLVEGTQTLMVDGGKDDEEFPQEDGNPRITEMNQTNMMNQHTHNAINSDGGENQIL